MNKLDELLYDALEKKDVPSEELNRRILEKAKTEDKIMAFGKRRVAAAAAIALCITLAGGTGYAAYRYMTAQQAAKELGSEELSAYFQESDVVAVKKDGAYRFRYLGNASAKLKKAFLEEKDTKTTYVALAVDRLDGKPMTEEEEFVASPLIQGLEPTKYNVYTMGGGAVSKIKNGVLYMIMSVNSIEMFADKEVYLAVTKGMDYADGYQYEELSGKISAKEDFEGINVLFTMEMDAAKADTKAQEEYLESFGKTGSDEEQEFVVKAKDADLQAFRELDFTGMDTKDIDKIVEKGDCIDSYEFEADDEGVFHVNVENKYLSAGGTFTKSFYKEGKATFVEAHYAEDEEAVIMQYDLLDDGGILHEKYIKFMAEQAREILK